MSYTPHDAMFRGVLGKPEHARGVLCSLVPPVLAEALDWQTLALCPGSFVDEALQAQHTDLLYSVTWRDGGEMLVYFLFEHQSAPPKDGLMAFRLLRYQVRIWDDWHAKNPNAKALPMIIPLVMYHGATPWAAPRWFGDLLAVPASVRPAVEPYLVQFAYLLDDLSLISDDELRDGAMMTALAKLVALCFKHARTRADFLQILTRWMDVVREVAHAPNGLAALAQVLCYILDVSEHVDEDSLKTLLAREIGPETKDAIVTVGQQIREEARQQERQKNRQRSQEVLLHLLRQRFGHEVDAPIERRVASASFEQVETWTERLLSATTLAELLAD